MQPFKIASNMAGVRSGECLPFHLQAHSLTMGRLGPIYRALETATGQVLTVERVDLVTNGDVTSLRKDLQQEMDELREKLPGTLCYDEIITVDAAETTAVFLVSRENARQTLTQVCKDFGRLHPLVVRQYTTALVRALLAVHEAGMHCGGLSSSTILLGDDQNPCIAAAFPSFAVVERIERSGVLAYPSVAQTALRRPLPDSPQAQDVRSVAYVAAEMLTGRRVRGSVLMDTTRFLDWIGDADQRKLAYMSFLQCLLSAQALTDEVMNHPFLLAKAQRQNLRASVGEFEGENDDAILQATAALQDQRRMIVALTKDELKQCQAQTQEATRQMRAWFRGFERQYGRKPSVDDRPPMIIRLQARCKGLADRIAMLNERLQTVNKSFYRAAPLPTEKPAPGTEIGSSSSLPETMIIQIPQHDESKVAADRTGPRRSPAQNAFLNRHGI